MKNEKKEGKTEKKDLIKDWIYLTLTIVGAAVLLAFFPSKTGPVFKTAKDYLFEMVWILPAVLIMMGLFKVWVSKEMVIKYLGKTSGLKGIVIAASLGATPTGPLYVAFPLAAAMLDKGARVLNIVVFLSAWACMKIPQEMVEIQFLGVKFMAARLILTLVFVSLMGFFIEKVIEKTELLET